MSRQWWAGARARVRDELMRLPPAAFAFVMATGIVAVGLELKGYGAAAWGMILIAASGYLMLTMAGLLRGLRWPHLVAGDLRNPARSFGSFTFVAGTNVLGTALTFKGLVWVPLVLLAVSLAVGVVLGYVVPWLAVLGEGAPPIKDVDGTWFVWVVAAQSVAVLAALLSPVIPSATRALSTIAVLGWSAGAVLYFVVAALVLVRLITLPVGPADMNQSYWITMGAMAITIVGGSLIVSLAPGSSPMVDATQQLISGFSVIMWSFATALIPALLAVGYWRHIVHRIPLHYRTAQWSVVFPLGMYAVAGIQLGRADELPLSSAIGGAWVWVGVVAWLLTFATMVVSVASGRRSQLPALPAGS